MEHLSKTEFNKLQNKEHARKTRRRKKMFHSLITHSITALEILLGISPSSSLSTSKSTSSRQSARASTTTASISHSVTDGFLAIASSCLNNGVSRVIGQATSSPHVHLPSPMNPLVSLRSSYPIPPCKLLTFRKFVTLKSSSTPSDECWGSICIPAIEYYVVRPKARSPFLFVVCRGQHEFMSYLEKKNGLLSAVMIFICCSFSLI